MKNYTALFSLLLAFCIFYSCQKDGDNNEAGKSKMVKIFMKDGPIDAEEINVEILGITLIDDDGNETVLGTHAGIYNLLEFQNGLDTLIAFGNVDLNDIEAMIMKIGNQNSIKIDGVLHDLLLRNSSNNMINVNLDELDNDSNFLIDFDACSSVEEENGRYYLNPVIHFEGEHENNNGNNGHQDDDFLEDIEDCFDIVYPITVVLDDGSTMMAANEDALDDILENNEVSGVVFPLNLIDEDGNPVTVNNEDELETLAENCENGENENDFLEDIEDCFDIVYPITLVLDDGSTITAANEDALDDILENNEVSGVVFPVNLIDEDGNVITANSQNELDDLLDDCD